MKTLKSEYFHGWTITFDPDAPVTGKWRAVRHGVGMCAGTRTAICRMVRAKVEDARDEQNPLRGAVCRLAEW